MTVAVLHMQAQAALFLHWSVPVATIAPLLPEGVEPDVVDGSAWIGLVALTNDRLRPLGLPAPGPLGRYPQVNVRVYGRDRRGRSGVVFLSMEAAQPLAAWAGRLVVGLPYRWHGIPVTRDRDVLTYGSRVSARIGEPVTSDPLERLVSGPEGLFLRRWGRLYWIANDHPPWPLHRADVLAVRPPAGPPVPPGLPDAAVFSPGVPMVLRAPQQA